jgi:hypothetical protein
MRPVSSSVVSGERVAVAQRWLADPAIRIVGWGSGSVFDYFQNAHPVRLDYLVDNDASRWGQSRRGVQIEPPSRLQRETSTRVLVIIYSGAWMDILPTLNGLDHVTALPATALFAGTTELARLRTADALAAAAPAPRSPEGSNAIVIQGPVIPGITRQVLATMSALHPATLTVLSTWRDTPVALLHELGPFVDELVVSDLPGSRGIQNRNCQIVTTRAGIDRAIGCGARTILKTRTDLAVMAPNLFVRAASWQASLDIRRARELGLSGRLFVPSSFTRKFLLYHPSDLVMLGAAHDLAEYWSAPLDPRSGNLLSPEWMRLSLQQLMMTGNPAESYLGTSFCRRIGWPVAGTLRDSWSFYRDLFVVADNDWFDLLWLKNLAVPDVHANTGPRQLVRQAFWQRLADGDSSVDVDLLEVNPATVGLRELSGMAA